MSNNTNVTYPEKTRKMKKLIETKKLGIILLALLTLTFYGCKKDGNDMPDNGNPKDVFEYDPNGIFILNEGNMTTENGSLTYLYSSGKVIDDAYKTVNGSELGNVTQDMTFCNGKIYIISQNGNKNATGITLENDGMLVIIDGKTLKKEKAFSNDELVGLDWPTHIAALDEQHVYIRDNKGIYRLNTETKELTFIEGSEGAPKTRFTIMNGKVYTFLNSNYLYSIIEISPESDSVNKTDFPYYAPFKSLYSIAKAKDNKIWFTATGFGKYYTGKFDILTKELVYRQISVEPSMGSAGISFCTKDDYIYYTNGTTIYRQKFIEDASLSSESGLDEEEALIDISNIDDNAQIIYNGLGIHPITGHVFVNSIKGYAQFTTNQIWEFDFETSIDNPVPIAKYENHTKFPAGFFFYPQATE